MTNLTSKSARRLKLLGLGFPVVIGLCLIAAKPASACLPAPGSRPAAIEQRVSQTPYVFAGTVTRVDGQILTIRVNHYFKGQGPEMVRLEGFNQTSCQDIISEPGGRYLFFGEEAESGTWNAVYDGAFGSVRPWSEELEAELKKLGLVEQPNSPPKNPGSLPQVVADAVRREASQRTRVPLASIQILSAERRTWSDNCLGLPFPARGCLQALTEGWLVRVRAGNQQLTYRTDDRGSLVYLDETNNSNTLPPAVSEAVTRDAAQLLGLSADKLQIIDAQRQTWPNGCLGLNFPDRGCTEALVQGWRVTLRAGDRQLVYRTDDSGNTVYLENGVNALPAAVREAVLTAAARQSGLPRNQLRITQAYSRLWNDSCLGVNIGPTPCAFISISGWQVIVEGRNNSLLVYHTNQDGSNLRFNEVASRFDPPSDQLPNAIARAVLEAAGRQTQLPPGRLRIVKAERHTWDGCLGIYLTPDQVCTKIAIPGWQVTVRGENNLLVYHTNQEGSDVRLNVAASQIEGNNSAINPVPIPQNELPPPLPTDAVFRAVSAGGFAGEVREITLWRDGKISIQSRLSGNSQTRWVSQQQVREFQQVLRQQRFVQYDRLSFPPPQGSADIIEVTLNARQGAMRYADYQTEKLPQPLQTVLASWQKLLNGAREQPLTGEGRDRNVSLESPATEDKSGTYPWLVERVLFEWLRPLF